MSDTETRPATGTSGQQSGATTPARRAASSSPLQTERGTTTIAENVVTRIAALAAREIDGVASMGGGVSGGLSSVVSRLTGGGGGGNRPSTAGTAVEVGQTQTAVDLTLRVEYPKPVKDVADRVRRNVIDRIESMTGLEVVEVNIAVVDLVFPGDEDDGQQDQYQQEQQQDQYQQEQQQDQYQQGGQTTVTRVR